MPITSLPDLDFKLWGIKRKKLTLIAARPSIGKSAFALQVAYDLARQMRRVLFLSLEMTVEDMLERLFCNAHKIDNQDLMRGNFKLHEAPFAEFKESVNKLRFVLSDCIGKSWQEIEELLEKLNPLPDAIFIDHINAIKSSGNNAKASIDDYLINMVRLAKHHNIAIILCCQINRDNQKDDDKTPQLHELKGSGNLEEAADHVIMLHWPHKYAREDKPTSKNHYIIILGKNRNGPTGYLSAKFYPEYYLFTDAEVEYGKKQ